MVFFLNVLHFPKFIQSINYFITKTQKEYNKIEIYRIKICSSYKKDIVPFFKGWKEGEIKLMGKDTSHGLTEQPLRGPVRTEVWEKCMSLYTPFKTITRHLFSVRCSLPHQPLQHNTSHSITSTCPTSFVEIDRNNSTMNN